MNNGLAWVHSFFKERHQFGEYHHHVSCIEEAPKIYFFLYLGMSFDIYDYILSKVHDRLEDPTTSTAKNRRI